MLPWKETLLVVLSPRIWVKLGKFDKSTDDLVNSLIEGWTEKGKGFSISDFYVKDIDSGLRLWVSNYPYCYGHQEKGDLLATPLDNYKLPYPSTIRRLRKFQKSVT